MALQLESLEFASAVAPETAPPGAEKAPLDRPALASLFLRRPLLMFRDLSHRFYETVFALRPPPPAIRLSQNRNGPRVAIIGAGVTGVSVAAHCIGNGIDCVLFEAGTREALGGVWARPSEHATLELESLRYRFYPTINQDEKNVYTSRHQILSHVFGIWSQYGLEGRTKFGTRVSSISRDRNGRWIVQESANGRFDAVVAATGTCGDPNLTISTLRDPADGPFRFEGPVWHTSDLQGRSTKGKKVLIIGKGEEAIQGLEFAAATGALEAVVLSEDDAWGVPKSPLLAAALAAGSYIGLDRLLVNAPERLSRKVYYNDLLSLFESSARSNSDSAPVVSELLKSMILSGRVSWLHGDVLQFCPKGVLFNHRTAGTTKGSPGLEEKISGSICVLGTGYHRPSLSFLSSDSADRPFFLPPRPSQYTLPNWFLQSFALDRMDVCAFNCTYVAPVGLLGNLHIALYTRLLLMFVLVPESRPLEQRLKKVVARSSALRRSKLLRPLFDTFAYLELVSWIVACVFLTSANGWRWVLFVLFGINRAPLSSSFTCNPRPVSPINMSFKEECNSPRLSTGSASPLSSSSASWKRLSRSSQSSDCSSPIITPIPSPALSLAGLAVLPPKGRPAGLLPAAGRSAPVAVPAGGGPVALHRAAHKAEAGPVPVSRAQRPNVSRAVAEPGPAKGAARAKVVPAAPPRRAGRAAKKV